MTNQISHFVTPQLPVRDVRENQRFYRDVLGLTIAWIHEEECGAVCDGHRFRIDHSEGPVIPPEERGKDG